MTMQNHHRFLHRRWHSGAGAEPGVNPRRSSALGHFGHFNETCSISVIDYSADSIVEKELDNRGLIDLLSEGDSQAATSSRARTPAQGDVSGASGCSNGKATVRWINIGGIDWGVLSALAIKYNLHALALEDVLHEQGHSHSKADYYLAHLFLRILCFSLVSPEGGESEEPTSIQIQTFPDYTATARPFDAECGEFDPLENVDTPSPDGKLNSVEGSYRDIPSFQEYPRKYGVVRRVGGLSGNHGLEHEQQVLRLQVLKGERVRVKYEPMFIFLLRDGTTVISVHTQPTKDFTLPISRRLHQADSLLRRTEDASLLVESLLDLVVDRVLEVMDVYQEKIGQLEQEILLSPNMDTVRRLHILSGDLIMHKRGLEPIKTMIYGLRRYDHERWMALMQNEENAERTHEHIDDGHELDVLRGVHGSEPFFSPSSGNGKKAYEMRMKGYLSRTAKVYLADVNDHMDFVLSSADMFSGIVENLINYAFNMASYETNAAMRRLTLVTIIFLPLTLLTGYFGMNFAIFPSIESHSDRFFWLLAIPGVAVVIPLFAYPELKMWFQHLERRYAIKRAKKGLPSV
ncbi:hypothetical protein AX16_007293 [Volvariella volvacea WC 439]|nr:hypothetical protein AX16_007293 [Volvariella volvacea WC 439]